MRSVGGGVGRRRGWREGYEEGEWHNHVDYSVSLKQAKHHLCITSYITSYQLDFQHYVCNKKCAKMDHEGPSMSELYHLY